MGVWGTRKRILRRAWSVRKLYRAASCELKKRDQREGKPISQRKTQDLGNGERKARTCYKILPLQKKEKGKKEDLLGIVKHLPSRSLGKNKRITFKERN